MAYQPQTYQDGVTEYTEELFEHMDDGIFGAYPVQLIAISDTAPSTCAKDDKYYNSTSKKIFTATATNTWGTNGETPLVDTSYWLISENGNYAWDGTDLVSIGGGKAEVIISDTEPSDGKLWVDTDTIQVIAGKENLVNVGTSVDDTFKTNLIKGKNLFDKNIDIITPGYYNASGDLVTTDTTLSCQSTYIKVKPNTKYTISSAESIIYRLCEYSSLKTFITRKFDNNASYSFTITTGNTTEYIRMAGVKTTALSSLQIEEGDTATTFEAFVHNSIKVNGYDYTETIGIGTSVDNSNRVNVIYGNLFDNSTDGSANGTYLKEDGTGGTGDSNLRITNYIPIDNTKGNLIVSGITSTMSTPALCFYDSSKTFISGAKYNGASEKTFVIPSNASYFKTSYRTTIVSTFFIKYPPSIVVDNEEIYSKPVVLWENGSPTSAFAGQQITLSDNIENYKWYEISFIYNTQYGYCCSTGKIPTSQKAILSVCSSIIQRRFVNALSGTSLTFLNGQKISSYNGSSTDDNTLNVPLQVLGYK